MNSVNELKAGVNRRGRVDDVRQLHIGDYVTFTSLTNQSLWATPIDGQGRGMRDVKVPDGRRGRVVALTEGTADILPVDDLGNKGCRVRVRVNELAFSNDPALTFAQVCEQMKVTPAEIFHGLSAELKGVDESELRAWVLRLRGQSESDYAAEQEEEEHEADKAARTAKRKPCKAQPVYVEWAALSRSERAEIRQDTGPAMSEQNRRELLWARIDGGWYSRTK